MPKYRVSMQERVFYSVYVEAADKAEAEVLAEIKFLEGTYSCDGQVDCTITDVELDTK